jgi:hypothetical protein
MLLLSSLLDMINTGKAGPGSPLETLTKKDDASYDY